MKRIVLFFNYERINFAITLIYFQITFNKIPEVELRAVARRWKDSLLISYDFQKQKKKKNNRANNNKGREKQKSC